MNGIDIPPLKQGKLIVLATAEIITKYHWRFKKDKSIIDHLVRLVVYIRQDFVKNQHIVGIFFDP